jgi:imidazolonepropionase-like amidohydrolase
MRGAMPTEFRVSGPIIECGAIVLGDGLIQSVGENISVSADAW